MNSSWLSFDPVFSGWVVAPIMLVLTGLFVWKELRRRNKFLPARILANVLILISMLGVLLRPSTRVLRDTGEAVLLTKGYDVARADSLLKANPGLKRVVAHDGEPYPESKQLASYQEIGSIPSIRFVIGEGIPSYALDLVKSGQFSFLKTKLPAGIVSLTTPARMVINKAYKLRGSFNSAGDAMLKLVGPAGAEDSVQFTQAGTFPFELSFKARQPGRWVYKCVEVSKEFGEKSYELPLVVEPERHLRMLFIQKFPTAEVRQLKNFLAEKGHALALRYQVSRNTFNYEYANLDRVRIDRLTPGLLASFDLLFIDSDVLAELGETNRNGLYDAVKQGLGITLLLNELPRNSGKLNKFFPPIKGKSSSDTVHLRLAKESYTLPAQPVEIKNVPSIQVITSHDKRILSGYQLVGFGKIGFQLLRETYRIRLEGNDDDYSQVWAELVERTGREQRERFRVVLDNRFPFFADEPLDVQVLSDGQEPTLTVDGIFTPLAEDVLMDDLWHGKVWAGDPGWHKLSVEEDSSHLDYYVSRENEWSALRIANQIIENKLRGSMPGSEARIAGRYEAERISPLVFFVAFLIASAFLWLAPKI
jgi:hypothetical protein